METLIDTIVAGFLSTIDAAIVNVIPYGVLLLGTLAAITYVVRTWPYVMSSGAGLGDALAGLILLMIALGVTLWVTQNMTAMGDGLYATATTIGLQASGASVNAAQLRSPSFILSMHKDVTRPLENFILAHTGWSALWNSPTLASFWIAEMIIYVVFVGISLSVALVVIEFYLSLAAAAFFVPCVVFAPSSALGEWVVGWVLGGTVRVFMLSLIVGIAVPLVDNLAGLGGGAGADPKWVEVLGLIAGALLFGVIAWTVPARAANFVGHGLGLGAETVMGAAMSAARFGQMATGAAVGAGRVTSRLLTRG